VKSFIENAGRFMLHCEEFTQLCGGSELKLHPIKRFAVVRVTPNDNST
jgi:hypothetical protein